MRKQSTCPEAYFFEKTAKKMFNFVINSGLQMNFSGILLKLHFKCRDEDFEYTFISLLCSVIFGIFSKTFQTFDKVFSSALKSCIQRFKMNNLWKKIFLKTSNFFSQLSVFQRKFFNQGCQIMRKNVLKNLDTVMFFSDIERKFFGTVDKRAFYVSRGIT